MGGRIKTVLHDILEFCLVYPAYSCNWEGGTDHFERLGGGGGGGGGGWDYRFKQNVVPCYGVMCCTVLSYYVFVS